MTNRFMISVATLALIAGTGFANAQGMSKESGGGAGGAAMQHSAPSDTSAAPSGSSTGPSKSEATEPSKAGEPSKGGMKSTQTDQKPGAMKNDRAEDNNVKGGATKDRAEDRSKGATDTQRAEDSKSGMKEGRDNNMKAEGRQDKSGNTAEGKSTTTTGQAGAGGKLTSDQRTKITSVIHSQKVESVTNVNFSVSVGTRVPREGVHFYPVPTEVVTIYPEWRGYEFIMVRDQIVIIDPHTYEIVEIIES
jgi:uncharacterized protein DUF1236